jgi:hypothetical protein
MHVYVTGANESGVVVAGLCMGRGSQNRQLLV